MLQTVFQLLADKAQRKEIILFPPGREEDLAELERIKGPIPKDWKLFYAFCNGWTDEELTILSLPDILDNELNWKRHSSFKVEKGWIFAEYLIYCMAWFVILDKASPTGYFIHYENYQTPYLSEFIGRFLEKGMWDGIMKWD